MSDYAHELEVAVQAVRRAALVCRSVQAKIGREAALTKADESPVTVADFASQALVCQALQAAFPADPVVAEEAADVLRTPEGARVLATIRAELGPFGAPSDAAILSFIDHGGAKQ